MKKIPKRQRGIPYTNDTAGCCHLTRRALQSKIEPEVMQLRAPRVFRVLKVTALVVFALLLADSLLLKFMRTRINSDVMNPRHGIAGASELRALGASLALYYNEYKSFPPTLASLGPPEHDQPISERAAGLVDPVLASGIKAGYRFHYVAIASDGKGTFDGFTLTADPVNERPATPHYFADQDWVIRVEAHSPATATSPILDNNSPSH